MRAEWRLLPLAFVAAMATSAAAETVDLQVGSCPTPQRFELSGAWEGAIPDPDAAAAIEASPGNSNVVAGLLRSSSVPGLFAVINSLGNAEPYQGEFDRPMFAAVGASLEAAIAGDPEMNARIAAEADAHGRGAGLDGPELHLEGNVLRSEDRFVAFAEVRHSDGAFRGATLFQFSAGCIINVQFHLPDTLGDQEIFAAVQNLRIVP